MNWVLETRLDPKITTKLETEPLTGRPGLRREPFFKLGHGPSLRFPSLSLRSRSYSWEIDSKPEPESDDLDTKTYMRCNRVRNQI
jgi:hypothetical protein